MSDDKPLLWQIGVSHYSEKARWALDYKRVPHRRRTAQPGMHIPVALWLTRGSSNTMPLLQLDGRAIADSTAIVAALEERFPDPPLYPADAALRTRALELEDFFDEELGPHTRLLPFYELIKEPELFAEVAAKTVPPPLNKAPAAVGAYASAYTKLRWGADDSAAAETSRAKITAAIDRLDAELEASESDYLVGDGFSVADLTAASLLYPLVAPPEGPLPEDTPTPPAFERFRESLSDRPGFAWVREMFRRHRLPGAGRRQEFAK